MSADYDKLAELADTLTDDQRRLLREGLASGEYVDPEKLGASLRSFDTDAMFQTLAVRDAGAGDAGTTLPPDGGTGDGGTSPTPPEPPLSRW